LTTALRRLIGPALLLACSLAAAQTVTFNGAMGDRALLVIDGQAKTVAIGASVQGVRLLGLSGDEARVEFGGRSTQLRIGTPVSMGGAAPSAGGQEIVLSAGTGGHFFANGAINGKAVRFLVDTGATTVSMSQYDADQIKLDYRNGQRVPMNTANGTVPAHVVSLNSVRIGDVVVYNVAATVIPGSMEHVLLGNSFLSRFQLKRDNDTLRLEKKP
jgi:aspartyl protease family protein